MFGSYFLGNNCVSLKQHNSNGKALFQVTLQVISILFTTLLVNCRFILPELFAIYYFHVMTETNMFRVLKNLGKVELKLSKMNYLT